MAPHDEIRIEQAAQRAMLREHGLQLSEQSLEIQKIKSLLGQAGLLRIVERQQRAERETAKKYQLIRDFAGCLPPACIEQTGKRMVQIIDGKIPAPTGAADIVARLRHAYGPGGLSTRTVRRALDCQN